MSIAKPIEPPRPSAPPPAVSTALKHVALLVETSGSYGRGLLRGIAKYNCAHGNWSTYFRPHGLADAPPKWLSQWRGDGLLVRIETKAVADLIARLKVPTVNLRGTIPNLPFPYVSVDNAELAKLAFQHFLDRGLKHFALCNRPRGRNKAMDERGDRFERLAKQAGYSCNIFIATSVDMDWEDEQEQMVKWIRALPKPVGIMAGNDERGLQVLDACRRCGASVPHEVAVLGVDNDESLCDLAIPPMSSIDVNAEGIGYEAASLLDQMMNGKRVRSTSIKIPPRGVVTRRSTDIIASEDEDVNRAVRYIREQACHGLRVVDVFNFLAMSRASLHDRMKKITGLTVHQEIQRVRMARAKELLVMSPMTIKQIARESGFASVQYMTRVFRAATGETPAQYRRQRAK
ncbi:MAG TPA: DNA-binding transcriptional regulator [Tepidisphaeraceae bacterium]|nr:DNA-binding transcriptional regulator [Tepidisphaeraceae bacterium]